MIVLGRGDPAAIFQMLGRTGRDGKPGLGFILVDRPRALTQNRKMSITDVNDCCSDYRRIKDFAETTVCVRIAMAVDNLWVIL